MGTYIPAILIIYQQLPEHDLGLERVILKEMFSLR